MTTRKRFTLIVLALAFGCGRGATAACGVTAGRSVTAGCCITAGRGHSAGRVLAARPGGGRRDLLDGGGSAESSLATETHMVRADGPPIAEITLVPLDDRPGRGCPEFRGTSVAADDQATFTVSS